MRAESGRFFLMRTVEELGDTLVDMEFVTLATTLTHELTALFNWFEVGIDLRVDCDCG